MPHPKAVEQTAVQIKGGRERGVSEATLAILCELSLSLSSLSLSLSSSAAAAFYDFPVQHRVSRGSTTPQHSYITGNFEIVEREFREAVAVRGCDIGTQLLLYQAVSTCILGLFSHVHI